MAQFKRYEALAKTGDAEAIYNLGVMYADGCGVVPDKKRSAELYKKAADAGHKHAIGKLKEFLGFLAMRYCLHDFN